MIMVSTGGFREKKACESVGDLINNGILEIELSGGRFSENIVNDLIDFMPQASFFIHNYFPPPMEPFVLNLASFNKRIFEKTHEHIRNAIMLSSVLGSRYYSFHAGFLVDPVTSELGKKISAKTINNRNVAKALFIERVNDLARFARDAGVGLLIENNVLSQDNYNTFKENPLLMVDAEETVEIMSSVETNVGLLLDVAHLKVSSNSLKFNPSEFCRKCERWILGYHLSDNNGYADTNSSFSKDAWFWPYIKEDLDYYSIEVYGVSYNELKRLKKLVSLKLGREREENNDR